MSFGGELTFVFSQMTPAELLINQQYTKIIHAEIANTKTEVSSELYSNPQNDEHMI